MPAVLSFLLDEFVNCWSLRAALAGSALAFGPLLTLGHYIRAVSSPDLLCEPNWCCSPSHDEGAMAKRLVSRAIRHANNPEDFVEQVMALARREVEQFGELVPVVYRYDVGGGVRMVPVSISGDRDGRQECRTARKPCSRWRRL